MGEQVMAPFGESATCGQSVGAQLGKIFGPLVSLGMSPLVFSRKVRKDSRPFPTLLHSKRIFDR
jgi:hypothetical protein